MAKTTQTSKALKNSTRCFQVTKSLTQGILTSSQPSKKKMKTDKKKVSVPAFPSTSRTRNYLHIKLNRARITSFTKKRKRKLNSRSLKEGHKLGRINNYSRKSRKSKRFRSSLRELMISVRDPRSNSALVILSI